LPDVSWFALATSGRLHRATVEEAVSLKSRSVAPCAPLPRLQVGGPGLSGALDKDFDSFQGAKTSEDVVAKVNRFARAGVDWVAVHDTDRFPPDVLTALADSARASGLRLMAAGNTPTEIAAALSIGPDTLDYFDRTEAPLYAEPTLHLLLEQKNLVLVPTPGVPYRTGLYAKNRMLLKEPDNFEFLTPADRAFVLENARKDLSGADGARGLRVLPTVAGKMRQLRSLGLPVAVGSDSGSALHFQAGAIWFELEAWRRSGATHREALTAATETGARVLKLDDVGHLRQGARADFILYRGNIERGRFELGRVMVVAKGGAVFVQGARWVP